MPYKGKEERQKTPYLLTQGLALGFHVALGIVVLERGQLLVVVGVVARLPIRYWRRSP
jgi:hypothetical protein